jgi:hypothetical protein
MRTLFTKRFRAASPNEQRLILEQAGPLKAMIRRISKKAAELGIREQ